MRGDVPDISLPILEASSGCYSSSLLAYFRFASRLWDVFLKSDFGDISMNIYIFCTPLIGGCILLLSDRWMLSFVMSTLGSKRPHKTILCQSVAA